MDEAAARKLWVETWKRAGPLLESIRHEELRAMTHEQAIEAFNSLSELALESPFYQLRTTSGLVEQQRLFLKLRQT